MGRLHAEWPPPGGVEHTRVERLAFLAARPQMVRWARPWWTRLLASGTSGGFDLSGLKPGPSSSPQQAAVAARFNRFAMRCDQLAARLTPVQVDALRKRGELPEWFWSDLRR